MTKPVSTALYIGIAIGSAVLLSACQLPAVTQQSATSLDLTATLSLGTEVMDGSTIKPVVTDTSIDQDLQSLDTLSQQSNPSVLGASSTTNASLGIQ